MRNVIRKEIAYWVLFSVLSITGNSFADELKFAGCSTSTLSYMKEAAKAYEAKTGIKVDVRGGGATLGIRSAIAGTVDMGGTCRHRVGEGEKDAKLTIVGYDALVFIVNKANPVQDISRDQVIQVLEGKITNWKALGGPDKPIIVVERKEEIDGARVMLNERLGHQIKLTDQALLVVSTSEVEGEVEKNPLAFGVSGSGSAVQRELKLLDYNGVAPNKESYLSGKYPLLRPLYLATKGETPEKMKKFFEFLLGPEGQAIVAKNAISIKEYKQIKR
jgi:phosphate transport system substrate-binding protein